MREKKKEKENKNLNICILNPQIIYEKIKTRIAKIASTLVFSCNASLQQGF